MLKQLCGDQMILKLKPPLCTMISHNTETACLDQLYDSTVTGFSVWPCLEKTISGFLSLSPPCYSCSQHSCVDLNGSLVSSTGLSSVVLSQPLPSLFPLRLPAPNNRYGNVPGRCLKATHERSGGEGGIGKCKSGGGGVRAVAAPSPIS